MELYEVIKSRKSVRAYKADTTIDKKTVENIIKTAMLAPSWKNSQTGRYYAVMSPEKVEAVREKCLPEFNKKNSMNAPVLIVTAFEKSQSGFDAEGNPVNELGDEWGAYDLGLQNQLLILSARDCGLDTLIMGIRDSEALRAELSIPDSQEIAAVIALGIRDGEPVEKKRTELDEVLKIF